MSSFTSQQPGINVTSSRAIQILVVDDHELFRRGVKSILAEKSLGEVCGEAEDGAEAVRMVRALHPDLVILDITMPVMNGFEAARRIRELAPRTKIIILTMHDSQQAAGAARAAGADAFLVKSEASAKLADTIQGLLSH
jgi:DNA-binding NarL/FixJ family response regulator